MNSCLDVTCMDARNIEKEEYAIAKRVKKKICKQLQSYRPVNPTVDNSQLLSRNNAAEESAENDALPSVTARKL